MTESVGGIRGHSAPMSHRVQGRKFLQLYLEVHERLVFGCPAERSRYLYNTTQDIFTMGTRSFSQKEQSDDRIIDPGLRIRFTTRELFFPERGIPRYIRLDLESRPICLQVFIVPMPLIIQFWCLSRMRMNNSCCPFVCHRRAYRIHQRLNLTSTPGIKESLVLCSSVSNRVLSWKLPQRSKPPPPNGTGNWATHPQARPL